MFVGQLHHDKIIIYSFSAVFTVRYDAFRKQGIN